MWAIEPKYDKVPRAYETLYPGLTTYLQRPKFWSLNFSFYNIQVLMNNDHLLTAATDLGAKGCSFAVYIFKCVFSPSRYVFRCHSSETGSKPILFSSSVRRSNRTQSTQLWQQSVQPLLLHCDASPTSPTSTASTTSTISST